MAAPLDEAMASLPVAAVLPALARALEGAGAAVLEAPPGAGKTTLVPLHLLAAPWLAGRRILMLEPRRLAARQAARRMAQLLGEKVGETVGYSVRFERKVGPATRIEVLTEGLLTRRLQGDPALEEVGAVIFDEFHERSLDADLALALCLDARDGLRPDLRLLVMSATIAGEAVAELLGGAPLVRSEGRMFPVRTRHLPQPREARIEQAMAEAVRRALAENEGSILCFLPGAAEIRRTEARLGGLGPQVELHALFGDLTRERQDAALLPAQAGRRKVVLATNIAETSLTIEGVSVVIDGGLARRPRFSPRTGMSRLETVRISRASAAQRRGRAGRLGPGVCYRLWAATDDMILPAFDPPEITEADLAPLALELAQWGAPPEALRWPTPPPAAALAQAHSLLGELGALDGDGRITPHGRRMAGLPLHPRLAHMLVSAIEAGLGATALALAALLAGRDPWRQQRDPDLAHRLSLWRTRQGGDAAALAELERVRRQLAGILPAARGTPEPAQTGAVLALAYPDRIAQRRGSGPGMFRMAGGRGARLDPLDPLAREPFLAVAELDDAGADARILSAAALREEDLLLLFGERIRTEQEVSWDRRSGGVTARRMTRLGALVLKERPIDRVDPALLRAALLQGLAESGLDALPWTPAARSLLARLRFLHRHEPAAWPDVGDEALSTGLADWLGPWLEGVRRPADLARVDLVQALRALLPWEKQQALDRLAPGYFQTPAGSRLTIDYEGAVPSVGVRLQELLGQDRHPAVLDGRVPLTLELLSPARRPIQVTCDLPGFWAGSYVEVRKEMRGRYPRHDWPENPLSAAPTRRTKAARERS
ncbi:ATP-dependent helicase HrpB [Geminicoccaceae bacterium 1502E]|nr:ATP-dependent helicase HrpB [Geminicoccaceae bacterium 1502E]